VVRDFHHSLRNNTEELRSRIRIEVVRLFMKIRCLYTVKCLNDFVKEFTGTLQIRGFGVCNCNFLANVIVKKKSALDFTMLCVCVFVCVCVSVCVSVCPHPFQILNNLTGFIRLGTNV
jgi:hypothetical protein